MLTRPARSFAHSAPAAITAAVQRLAFVDWTRGFAVLAMVLWHSGDAWLQPALHAGEGFYFLRFVGGLAAPSFLLLAGMASALGARSARDAGHARALRRANLLRGFEVLLLGYVLRLQTWLVDAAAIRQLHTLRAWLPLALGYAALFWSARSALRSVRGALAGALLGAVLALAGLLQVEDVAPGRLGRLLQVDVLQAIGASLMVLAWLSGADARERVLARPAALLAVGVGIAALTPFVWAPLPAGLPHALAGYLGRFDPAPGATPAALFPLFPWLAYACLGAAAGRWLRAARAPIDRPLLLCMLLGAALAGFTSEAHGYIQHWVSANPSTLPLLRVAFRVGIIAVLLGIGFVLPVGRAGRALIDLGRASLRVYWFHLPFAYGLLGRPLRGRLGYLEWAATAVLLLLGMWGLSRLRFAPNRRNNMTITASREPAQDRA